MDPAEFTRLREVIDGKLKSIRLVGRTADDLRRLEVAILELEQGAGSINESPLAPTPTSLPAEPVRPEDRIPAIPPSERYLRLKSEVPSELKHLRDLHRQFGRVGLSLERRFAQLQSDWNRMLNKVLQEDAPPEIMVERERVKTQLFRLRMRYPREMAEWRARCSAIGEANQRALNAWNSQCQADRVRDKAVRRLGDELAALSAEPNGVIRQIPWQLLPPPEPGHKGLVRVMREITERFSQLKLDLERLKFAYSLCPHSIYIGLDKFDGYLAFVFTSTKKVLLECPVEGNAAYIFSESWEKFSRLSKTELLSHQDSVVQRVVHRDIKNWKQNITHLLG